MTVGVIVSDMVRIGIRVRVISDLVLILVLERG